MAKKSPLQEVKGFGGLNNSTSQLKVGHSSAQTKDQSEQELSEQALNDIKNKRQQNQPAEAPEASTESMTPEAATVEPTETAVTNEPNPEPAPAITLEAVQSIMQQAVNAGKEQGKAEAEAEAQQTNDALTQENEQLRSQVASLEDKAKETDYLKSIFTAKGMPTPQEQGSAPNVNTRTSPNDSPKGAMKEALEILNSSAVYTKKNSSGRTFYSADPSELNYFVRHNKEAVIRGLEQYGKAHGLLSGNVPKTYGEVKAATTGGDIPGGFLEVLSALMRTINRGRYIFWQFPTTVHNFALGNGDLIDIPRAKFNKAPRTSDDRRLSGKGVYRKIDAGNQSVQTGIEQLILEEFGLGANPDAPPIAIPTFVSAYSMINLMEILNRNLYQDYLVTEDLLCREPLLTTNAIVYNNGDEVTSDPLDLIAGSDGQITPKFLNKLFAYMQTLQIPTYDNGMYALVLPTTATADFKNNLDDDWEAPSAAALKELTEILNPALAGEMDRVNGFVGSYNNFMLFDTNTYGVGSATLDGYNGVQTETLGVGARDTLNCLAMGANVSGRGVGSQFNIVRGDDTDFNRSNRYIWTSDEAHAPIDVCPVEGETRPVPQQLRVLKVRHSVQKLAA